MPRFARYEQSFLADYGDVLSSMGCTDIDSIIQEVKDEVARRRDIPKQSYERTQYIKQNYVPLYPEIFTLQDNHFDPEFLKAFQKFQFSKSDAGLGKIMNHHGQQVYSFPLLSETFCHKLCSELRNFESSPMPKSRPNSMNRYGVLVDELGLNESLLNPLREIFIGPLCKLFFPRECGATLDSHKAFTVHYELGKDVELGFHFDNAEVTLNVCLEADCEGGELNFGSFGLEHRVGYAILHRGSQQHSVLPLESGRRVNLIVWMRSSSVRNLICPMCNRKPDLEPVRFGYGDGFTD